METSAFCHTRSIRWSLLGCQPGTRQIRAAPDNALEAELPDQQGRESKPLGVDALQDGTELRVRGTDRRERPHRVLGNAADHQDVLKCC